MLNLRKRELPAVEKRYDLPLYLAGEDSKECYLKFEARAAGRVNPLYTAAVEQNAKRIRVRQMLADQIREDTSATPEAYVDATYEGVKQSGRDRLTALYDACMINWSSNILNGDAVIEASRENFLALAEARVPEIADALADFEKACNEAGEIQAIDDEEERGN